MVVNKVTVVIMTVVIVTVVIVKVEIMTVVIVTVVKLTIVIVTIEIVTGLGDLYFAKLQISQTRPDQKRTLFRTLSVMSTDFPRIFPLLLFFSSTI